MIGGQTLRNATLRTLQTDIGAIDLLAEITGLGAFEDIRRQSITVAAFGCQILTLNLPALILSKRSAGREKDLLDLVELESILKATL